MNKEIEYLEIEVKFRADEIDRLQFKEIVKSLNPKEFLYIESTDVYFLKSDTEFLRYRMSADNTKDKRAELAFKKKHSEDNNIIRTEVNLRVDNNKPELVQTFVEGLGYKKNFLVTKICDIYRMEDAFIVYYSVKEPQDKEYQSFIEIETLEGKVASTDEAWEIIRKYEKLLEPLGITPQNRLKKSLFEMFKKPLDNKGDK